MESVPPSKGLGELVSTTLETILECVSWDGMLGIVEKPAQVIQAVPLPRVKDDDIQALLAQAKQGTLPPPPGLPHPPPDDPTGSNGRPDRQDEAGSFGCGLGCS